MQIHITRESCHPVINGAGASENTVRSILQSQELKTRIACRVIEAGWMSNAELEKQIVEAIKAECPNEDVAVVLH